MKIQNNISLKPYNTFGLDAIANQFIEANSLQLLKDITEKHPADSLFILGGGSNMLLTQNLNKLVVKINLKGIKVIDQTDDIVMVEAQAGENWHDFVIWTIKNNFGGLENLSLIPGNVGTTPIQNIGAYGVEVKDHLISCKALNIKTNELVEFTNEQCKFDYRESVFKTELKDQFIIVSVVFKLTKTTHILKTGYGAIQEELTSRGISNPSIKDISDVVIAIRSSKLPNPEEIGNSGSFFKNPIVDIDLFNTLQKKYPNIPSYVVDENSIKIPAGWLIEQAGFKGYRLGDAGVHVKQALVLVNYGKAEGIQIKKLAFTIQKEVEKIFGITISPEVNIF